MKKQSVLVVVNSALFVDFLLLIVSALLRLRIPYEIYRVGHPVLGYTLLALVISHIILNFNWIRANILKKKR